MNRQDHELAEHDPWLRRLARRLARSRARADDLVQDTYLTALRNAPDEVQMRPWLHAVMRKLAWGQVRSERRRVQREEGFSLMAPMVTLPDVLPEHGIDRARLGDVVARLPEPFQSTIVQRFFQGRSCADIARLERVPAATVRWRQARGLELLRAELAPPRRRFVIWALPFLGVGEQLIVRCWQAVVTRLTGSKAIWLLMACAAVLYAIIGHKPPPSLLAGDADDRRDGIALADVSASLAASFAQVGGSPLAARRVGGAGSDDPAGSALAIAGRNRGGITGREFSRGALDDALDAHQDECVWDPVHGRQCVGAGSPTDALCAMLQQQLAAGQALALGSPTGRSMLAASLLANRARAERLGCPSVPGDPRSSGKSGSPGDPSKPSDTPPTDELPPQAPPPPADLPANCDLRTIETGLVCTVCISDLGFVINTCPVPVSTSCHSRISPSGLVCSTCDGQPGPPECLPAECGTDEHGCLQCVDPKDRSATDCTRDLESSAIVSGGNPGGYMETCTTISGSPSFSGMTCHYPGTQSCEVRETTDSHCLACEYRDSSDTVACSDASEPLPDPLAGRPTNLPAPGQCVTELAADGTVTCATCTRADLSTTRSCR